MQKIFFKNNTTIKWWLTASFLFFMLGFGFSFYNTNILNNYISFDASCKMKAHYEVAYKKYLNSAQPRITDVNLMAQIFPKERRVRLTGNYI